MTLAVNAANLKNSGDALTGLEAVFEIASVYTNGMPVLLDADADWESDPYYGIPDYANRGSFINEEGYNVVWGTQADADGVERLMFCAVEGLSHMPTASYARIVWEMWFTRFTNEI